MIEDPVHLLGSTRGVARSAKTGDGPDVLPYEAAG